MIARRSEVLNAIYSDPGFIHIVPLMIRPKTGTKLIRLIPNRAQAEYGAAATSRDLIVKARQVGMSTIKLAEFYQRASIFGQTCFIISHESDHTQRLFRRIQLMHTYLSDDMRPRTTIDNRYEMTFPDSGGQITIGTARAKSFGRGDTIDALHWSETAQVDPPLDEQLWLGIQASCEAGDISFESTARGQIGVFWREYQRAVKGLSDFTVFFFPWWYAEEYSDSGWEW